MREHATIERIAELAETFMRDEVHHRELGWVTLEWALAGPTGTEMRELARTHAPRMLAQRGAKMCTPRGPSRPPTGAERAWGILARDDYADVFARACRRDVVPRFARLGIDVG